MSENSAIKDANESLAKLQMEYFELFGEAPPMLLVNEEAAIRQALDSKDRIRQVPGADGVPKDSPI